MPVQSSGEQPVQTEPEIVFLQFLPKNGMRRRQTGEKSRGVDQDAGRREGGDERRQPLPPIPFRHAGRPHQLPQRSEQSGSKG